MADRRLSLPVSCPYALIGDPNIERTFSFFLTNFNESLIIELVDIWLGANSIIIYAKAATPTPTQVKINAVLVVFLAALTVCLYGDI